MVFLKKLFIFLIKTKIIFKKPPKKEILIYDKNLSEYILKYIDKEKTCILNTRYESLNINVLFHSILKNKFKDIFLNYVTQYIKIVDPKIIVTLTDTDLRFYQIKSKIKTSIKVIAIQNGQIGSRNYFELAKKEKNKKSLRLICDHILVANKEIIKQYKKIIESNFIVIGSFKNNSSKVYNKKKQIYLDDRKKKIFFLSQFYPPKKDMFDKYFEYKNFFITFKKFFSDDILILNLINEYCKNRKIKLYIKLRHFKKSYVQKEKKFFKENLKFKNLIFLKRKNNNQNYKVLDSFDVTIFIDSFMGYESFARGNLVASISARAKTLRLKNANFADNSLPPDGFFWTNKKDKNSVNKILNNVLKTNYNSWNKLKKRYSDKVMAYDENNKIFKNLINKILNSNY